MIEWFDRSRSARISSRARRVRVAPARSSEERPQPLADVGGSTPSRYSSAVPRSFGSSVCRPRNAICSGSRGSTSDSSVKTCARLWPARSLHELVDERALVVRPVVEQPVALPHRRPTATSRVRRRRCARGRSGRAGSSRAIAASDGRTGTGPRSAGRRGRAAGRRRRAATRRPRTRAPAGAGRRNAGSGSISASISSPTRSSATLRSARTASSATGSQASSGMTCGTSAARQAFFVAQDVQRPGRGRATAARGSPGSPGRRTGRSARVGGVRVGAVARHAAVARASRRACAASTVRVVMSSTSDRSSSTARLSRLRSSVWM